MDIERGRQRDIERGRQRVKTVMELQNCVGGIEVCYPENHDVP